MNEDTSPTVHRKLGVALVGLGEYAETSIAPEIVAACEHVRLAGVVTSDPRGKGARWAAKYGFPESAVYSYETMDRMADNPDIDFVHVVTPTGKHCEHTVAAAHAGKHVMVEKPMAISVSECQTMITACRGNGVQLGVNYRLLWEPHHVEMGKLARSGKLGEVRSITAEFSWNRGQVKPWLLDKKLGFRGALFDTGVYLVQAGVLLTGENPSRVAAVASAPLPPYSCEFEETMSLVMDFPSGAVLQARSSYAAWQQTLICACSTGSIECVGHGPTGTTFGQTVGNKPNPKILRLSDGSAIKHPDTLQAAVVLDEFAGSILNKHHFFADGEMGLRDIAVLEAAYRSLESCRPVEVCYPSSKRS